MCIYGLVQHLREKMQEKEKKQNGQGSENDSQIISHSQYLDKDLKGSGHKKINDDSFTEEDISDIKHGFMNDKELFNNNG